MNNDIVTDRYHLHLGDCLEFMHMLPDGAVDAVIADPPYGILWDGDSTRFTSGFNVKRTNHGSVKNDDKSFDPTPFLKFRRVIIWGYPYFADKVPIGNVLVWDKRFKNGSSFLADAEIGWSKSTYKKLGPHMGGYGSYIYSETCQGFVRADAIYHPTQKPTGLMRWCIELITKEGDTVFDPFMGSGTTGVACMQLGRRFIGSEIDPDYFAIAEKRIREAAAQPPLFTLDSTEAQAEQLGLFDD